MKKQNNPKVFAEVWKHWKGAFREHRVFLVLTTVFYLTATTLESIVRPLWWKKIFDSLSLGEDPWRYFYVVAGISFLAWFFHRMGDQMITRGEAGIIKSLKNSALSGLLKKSANFFLNQKSGAFITKTRRFVMASEAVIDECVFTLFRSVILVSYLVVFLFLIIPSLAGLFSIWIILFVGFTLFILKKRMPHDIASSEVDSKTGGHLGDIVASIMTLRVFNTVFREYERYKKTTEEDYQKRLFSWNLSNIQWAVQAFLVLVLEVVAMKIVITNVLEGKETIGTAVMVQVYIGSLTGYMYALGRSLNRVRTSLAESFELAKMLDEEDTEILEDDIKRMEIPSHTISCTGLYFTYKNGVQALSNFNFEFMCGRKYGIVGETGSGKSTLTRLILNFHSKDEGSITIGGHDITDIPKPGLRSLISYVSQDQSFPSKTVREIISMGSENATEDEILLAAQKASCDFIKKLPYGLDTRIGERGVKLSGGERQRLAIAAAILKDAPIVIMDEPTSALDAITERAIQDALSTHFIGKTLIVIAHRLSTVAILDEIVVLHEGALLANGSHEELIENSELYKNMWELQTNPKLI